MKEAYLYEKLPHNKVKCKTCWRECLISDGKLGFCRTRKNRNGTLYSLEYGLISSLSINPAEKKPFYHFYPGSMLITVGSWSCTFTCPWCQNHQISKHSPEDMESQSSIIYPERLVQMALDKHCRGTSMSFSEPATFLEYMVDVFALAKENDLCNTVVTNGYFTTEALDLLLENGAYAFNIDIKGDADTYQTYCRADVDKVWQNVKRIKEKNAHLELTTLVIPEVNDDDNCLQGIAEKIINEAGPETPWHVSRYFPAYQFDKPATPIDTLEKAYQLGKEKGLLYVYLGNVSGHPYENTYCPSCGEELISRCNLTVGKNILHHGKCPFCKTSIPVQDD
ncbi:MAG: hypothetical protein AMJ79_02080 [Phycisphaerae bacterium SM23_30]|nr:MAG: hypothetical protein AMJ79_02080 [Phycisphaerae bacterium SM23_30]